MTEFYGGGPNNKYGSGAFYGETTVVIIPVTPIELQFYRTTQDGIYTFYWTFNPADISANIATFDYELQLDSDPSFSSPNLVSFTSSSVITYQNGNVWKGYTVPVAARIDKITQTWYARVKVIKGSDSGNWSSTLVWTIPQKWQQQTAEDLMNALPDNHVYGKGDLLLPPNQRNSNLYLVENMYGAQFDAAYYENFLTKTDNYISLCRDEFLYQNFGVLFNYTKPNIQTFVEYRQTLKQLILGSLNGSTLEPVLGVIQTFTGVPPLIENVRDLDDFFLNLVEEIPTNILQNGGFESWTHGTSFTNPPAGTQLADNWFLDSVGSASFVISRNSSVVDSGTYSLEWNTTSVGSGTYLVIYQPVSNYKIYAGQTVSLTIRVNSNVSGIVAVISDGITASYSNAHTGGGTWQTLSVSHTMSNTPSELFVLIQNTSLATPIVSTIYLDSAALTNNSDVPNGIRTHFNVQYEFVSGSMQIFKNGTILAPGIDFTEDQALPGFIMTVPPSFSDTLNVFYQIGKPTDPRPILFDPSVNAVQNGGFENWSNGTSFINPANGTITADDWEVSSIGSATFTISRESTIVDSGSYSLKWDTTSVGSGTYLILFQQIPNYRDYLGKSVSISFRVKSNTAGIRVILSDNFGTGVSNAHTGDGTWQTLTATFAVSNLANNLAVALQSNISAAPVVSTVYFDTGVLLDNTVATFITGEITYTNGSLDVVGTGTSFISQLVSGDILVDSNGYYAEIADVETNTTLKLVDAWGGPTETVYAMKATYNIQPIVLWDKSTLAFGVIITVLNPADFDIDLLLIEALVNPLLPAMTKVFYQEQL